jgi:Co/Zn/Cd efflux system component
MATITENLLGPSGRMISNDSTNLMKDQKNRNKSENGNESENGKDPLIFGFLMSNQFVLQITCASFLLFVIAEIFGAIIGNSWSLLGDAAAMSVDVMTYFTNMQAERIKARSGYVPIETKMILEVWVPTFSVCALLGVTAYVTVGAVHDIIYKPEDDDVDIYIMYGFAIGNTVVDVLSVYMFWLRGKQVFEQDRVQLANADSMENDDVEEGIAVNGTINTIVTGTEKNLNMISAFTHVGGDTLRTISIFIAAMCASFGAGAPYLCDAWAAVVVTVTIVAMVIPLINEICLAYSKISIEREEEEHNSNIN